MREAFDYIRKNCTFRLSVWILMLFGVGTALCAILMGVGTVPEYVARIFAVYMFGSTITSLHTTMIKDCGRELEERDKKVRKLLMFLCALLIMSEFINLGVVEFESVVYGIVAAIICSVFILFSIDILSLIMVENAKNIAEELDGINDKDKK